MTKTNIKKQTTKNNWVRLLSLLLLGGFYLILSKNDAFARIRYPISELGGCRNEKECYLYCQIPVNTPACWSYDKYVLRNVLGETTVNIDYPVAELDNCTDAKSCFEYCKEEENYEKCTTWAENIGLSDSKKRLSTKASQSAQEMLGCDSYESCLPVCEKVENYGKCAEFAQEHGLEAEAKINVPNISSSILSIARRELGCRSTTSCAAFCEDPENKEKCDKFSRENNLISEKRLKSEAEFQEKQEQLLKLAEDEFKCQDVDSCKSFCSDPINVDKCIALKNKLENASQEAESEKSNSQTNESTLPCTGDNECQAYCAEHPDECEGYYKKALEDKALNGANDSTSTISAEPGDFLGPTGCKTEAECDAYCEKHPDECPGYPEKQNQPFILPDKTTPQSEK